MDRKFREERNNALEEIQKALTEKMREKALWSQEFVKGKESPMSLPDYMQLQETFRAPAFAIYAVTDLKDDKSLKEVFSRVSGRYQAKDPRQVLGVASDLVRSPEAKTDGRLSAFEDVLKVLEVAERDFDATYKPLTRESLDYWRKKHPIDDQNLEIAYRENQRHFMTESLKEIRQLVLDLRDAKPSPGAAPKTPRP
ncbi:MAG: hypothetical protein ACAH80_14010 [Alphaproteobacteria bacterium]